MVSHILDLIHGMVTNFSFDHGLVKTEKLFVNFDVFKSLYLSQN